MSGRAADIDLSKQRRSGRQPTEPVHATPRRSGGATGTLTVDTVGVPGRTMAAAIDLAIVLSVWFALPFGLGGGSLPARETPVDHFVRTLLKAPYAAAASALVLLALHGAWHTLGEALLGGSPGKRLLGFRAIAGDGRAPRPARALLHAAARLLTLVALGLGPAWALVDREHRTLYDRLAGIRVVKRLEAGSAAARDAR